MNAPQRGSTDPNGIGPSRVLVVDSSAARCSRLVALLAADPALEVAGWASGGEEAVRATARLKPDVIAMELAMPNVDGLAAARRIMAETPTPIVLIAEGTGDRAGLTGRALEAGALALVPFDQPTGGELVRTIKSMAGVRVVRRWAPQRLRPRPPDRPAARAPNRPIEVIGIGASTGGPQALQDILTRLPADFAVPILVVQHIADGFASSMVDWLRGQCALPIRIAEAGQRLDRPGISVAPSGRHLIVRGRAIALTDEPPVHSHRPSATRLFESIAREYGPAGVGVLLTGMGEDGARGLGELRRHGGVTIAQDEASSVVFGMPGVAIAMGAVDHIVPPLQVAPLLIGLVERGRGR